MSDRGFHVLFVAAYLALLAIRLASWRAVTRSGSRVTVVEGRLNMAVRAVLGLGYIGALLVYVVYPRYLDWATFSLPAWARWLGLGATGAALLLLAWVQWALGQNFSSNLHVRQGHTLVTHGPYRWVRHPMYTALFAFGLGILLLTTNWAVGGPLMVALIAIVIVRVGDEERLMIEQFGDAYQEYARRTGRFLPRLTY